MLSRSGGPEQRHRQLSSQPQRQEQPRPRFAYSVAASYIAKDRPYNAATHVFHFNPYNRLQQTRNRRLRPESGQDAFFVSRVGDTGGGRAGHRRRRRRLDGLGRGSQRLLPHAVRLHGLGRLQPRSRHQRWLSRRRSSRSRRGTRHTAAVATSRHGSCCRAGTTPCAGTRASRRAGRRRWWGC